MKPNKYNFDLDEMIDRIIEGDTLQTLANDYACKLKTVWDFLNRTTPTDENGTTPRARYEEARKISATVYADKALQILLDCKGLNSHSVHLSNYQSSRLAWMAAMRDPKNYHKNNEIDVKTTKTIKVNTDWSGGKAVVKDAISKAGDE